MRLTPETSRIILAVAFALFFVSYLALEVHAFTKSPELKIISIEEDGLNTVITGEASRQARVFLNGEEILLDPNGFFSLELNLPLGESVLNFKAVSRLGKESNVQEIIRR